MKTLSTLGLLGIACASVSAHADLIRCSFTEPFIDTVYSTTQSTLTISDFDGNGKPRISVIKNVSLQIVGPGAGRKGAPAEFELRDAKNRVIQKLTLNYEGSDGMSDLQFPYDVQWNTPAGGRSTLSGGCSSNALPRFGSDT